MNTMPSPWYEVAVNSRFLRGLGDVDAVLDAARIRHCAAGQLLTQVDDPATHIYLMLEGRARSYIVTEEGRRLKLRCLTPGEAFGLQALLPSNATYLLNTEIRQAATLLSWDRGQIHRLAMAHPALFVNALALASEYLASYLAAQVALVSQSADRRLARVLLSLSRAIGRQCEDAVELDMNNQTLAEMANISPFTASRLLSRWQREGTIRKTRGKLLVQNPQRLMPD